MNKYTDVVRSKVLKAVDDYSMLSDTTKIVVGFSGGADSVCLLHILNSLKCEFRFDLIGAHVNHGIRGDEALRDAVFARNFCEKLGVDFKLHNADCIKLSEETGESLEVCGRNERYAFFHSLSDNNTRVATAHNANDNAETVLFNIARGSTIKGGGGIPPVRGDIIRPLIYCTRREIEGYCEENELEFVTDSTNLSDDYTRNKIRHKVLPILEEINSEAISNFTHFSISARETAEYICNDAESVIRYADNGNGTYKVTAMLEYSDVVVREAIVILLRNLTDKTLERKKLDEILALLKRSGRIQVYGDIFAEVVKGSFRFFKKGDKQKPEPVPLKDFPFENQFGGYCINVSEFFQSSEKINKKLLDNLIDCDKIEGNVFLRTRQEGDKITLPVRNVTKTLKKLFNEMNIPVEKRDLIPVLSDENGVLWVYSVGVDARCHVDANSSNIIFIGGKNND
ncbi:MAG: tRNA lysidine(34) synthetase TilS [Clostridia bacterium]|nr:tRNA lysidine(34) synthetase TilS [Clostridia bacterium]